MNIIKSLPRIIYKIIIICLVAFLFFITVLYVYIQIISTDLNYYNQINEQSNMKTEIIISKIEAEHTFRPLTYIPYIDFLLDNEMFIIESSLARYYLADKGYKNSRVLPFLVYYYKFTSKTNILYEWYLDKNYDIDSLELSEHNIIQIIKKLKH